MLHPARSTTGFVFVYSLLILPDAINSLFEPLHLHVLMIAAC